MLPIIYIYLYTFKEDDIAKCRRKTIRMEKLTTRKYECVLMHKAKIQNNRILNWQLIQMDRFEQMKKTNEY